MLEAAKWLQSELHRLEARTGDEKKGGFHQIRKNHGISCSIRKIQRKKKILKKSEKITEVRFPIIFSRSTNFSLLKSHVQFSMTIAKFHPFVDHSVLSTVQFLRSTVLCFMKLQL